LANGGGEGATRAVVIGRPLVDFVAGDAARMFVNTMLDSARLLGSLRVLPYRCDSPTRRRRFAMTVTAQAGGLVLFQHHLVLDEPRPDPAMRQQAGATIRWRCSQCPWARQPDAADRVVAGDMPSWLPTAEACRRCAARRHAPDSPLRENRLHV
jgi:hypothetical protein